MNIKIKKNLIFFVIIFLLQLCIFSSIQAADEIEDEELPALDPFAGGAGLPLWRQYAAGLDIRGANQHLKAFGGNLKGFNKYIKY